MRRSVTPTRTSGALGVLGLVLLTVVLVYAGLQGVVFAAAAAIVPVGLIGLCVFGARKVGFALLCLGYLFAAFGKGSFAQLAGPSLTISDVALLFGLILLSSRFVPGANKISAIYAGGMFLVIVTGLMSSTLIDPLPTSSLKTVIGMLWVMLLIPMGIAGIRPSNREVQTLAWSFIVGHLINIAYAFATNPGSTRQFGLTAHPNEYAESGLICVTLVAYLLGRTSKRYPLYVVLVLSLASIYLSGSRGALIGVAAVLLAIPVIERTALGATLFTAILAIGAAFLPIASQTTNQDSAFGRLIGNGASVSGSDTQRQQGISFGVHEFLQRPFTGSGLSNLFAIHINVLEIAVGLGVFGLVGFLLVVGSQLSPIFGRSEHRRFGYVAVAFVVFSATAPALTDRGMWLAMSLGFVYFRGFADQAWSPEAGSGAAKEDELVVDSDHLPQLR